MEENLDFKKIKLRTEEIENALKEIREYIAIPEENFWKDHRNILAIEQLLLRAIEAAGGICIHIAAKKLKRGVENIADCFELLEKEQLLKSNLSLKLRNMVKFRNKLIHRYWEINDKNILEYARNDLKDFEDFTQAINDLFLE